MWIDSDISVAVVAPWSVRWCWERGVAGGWRRYGGCQAQMVTVAAANAVNASSRRVGWASGVARTSRSIWAIHLTPLVAQLGAVAARTSVLDTCWISSPSTMRIRTSQWRANTARHIDPYVDTRTARCEAVPTTTRKRWNMSACHHRAAP